MDYGDKGVSEAAAEAGLPNGRMISHSKSWYRGEHPRNVPVFNGTIALDDGRGVWWGDLDLTIDEPRLVDLARRLGCRLHVLFEGDTWPEIRIEDAVMVVEPTGEVAIRSPYLERDGEGRVVRTARPD